MAEGDVPNVANTSAVSAQDFAPVGSAPKNERLRYQPALEAPPDVGSRRKLIYIHQKRTARSNAITILHDEALYAVEALVTRCLMFPKPSFLNRDFFKTAPKIVRVPRWAARIHYLPKHLIGSRDVGFGVEGKF